MPVSYSIDKSKGLIHTRCAGNVVFDEVAAHFRELRQDPDCPDRLDVLLDLTDVTSTPTSDQLRDVAQAVDGLREKVRFGGCAIAASTDVLFGMSRVLEVLGQKQFRAICVFRSVDEAEAWLLLRMASQASSQSA